MPRNYIISITGNDTIERDLDSNHTSMYCREFTAPGSGNVLIEYKSSDGNWYPMPGGIIDLSIGMLTSPRVSGLIIRAIRVTTSGMSPSDLSEFEFLATWIPDANIDPRVYTGLQAFTTQGFTEANVKNGSQFDAANYVPALASLGSVDLIFQTGSLPVLIKAQNVAFDGAGVQVELFEGPTYSGGVSDTPFNLSDIDPKASTVTILMGVTTTDDGVKIAPTLTMLGGVEPGNKATPTGMVAGLDRALAPNTTYLRRITSIDGAGAQRVATYATWYEGPLSSDS